MRNPYHTWLSAIALGVALPAQGALVTQGQIVLSTGDAAPGSGVAIDATSPFSAAATDLDGNLVFAAKLDINAVGGAFDQQILCLGRGNGDLVTVIRGNDTDPSGTYPGAAIAGGAAGTLNGLGSNVRISPRNEWLMFGAGLYGTGITSAGAARNDSAIYHGTAGNLQILVQRGDAAPIGGSTITTSFSNPSYQATALNENGTAVFKADLTGGDVNGTTNDDAWVIGTPGSLQFLIREGDPLLSGQVAVGRLGFNCLINPVGIVIHDETLSTTLGATPATAADDSAICVYYPGGTNIIAMREGDPVPNATGLNYDGAPTLGSSLSVNGEFVFFSRLAGPGVTGTGDDSAIFLGNVGGGVNILVREGAPVPALPGLNLGVIFTSALSNNSQGAAFIGILAADPSVNSTNDSCMFFASAAGLELIAREGDPAPGFAAGSVIGATSGRSIVAGTSSPLLNELGHIVFSCRVLDAMGTEVAATYGYVPGRGLQLLGAEGDVIPTGQGNLPATSFSLLRTESGDSAPLGLNNHGDFVARANLGGPGAIVRGHLGGLQSRPASVSLAGGTLTMELDAGASNAGNVYFLAGSTSGARPGTQVTPQIFIPLNLDTWVSTSFGAINALYPANFGVLDGAGQATATMVVPAGFPQFAGTTIHHAFGVVDAGGQLTYVSEPASVLLY